MAYPAQGSLGDIAVEGSNGFCCPCPVFEKGFTGRLTDRTLILVAGACIVGASRRRPGY